MHAAVVTVAIKDGRLEEAKGMLNNMVVPMVSQSPGFVSGTWTESADGSRGHSLIIFETEEAAQAGVEMAKQGTPPEAPVTILYGEVYEVVAQA